MPSSIDQLLEEYRHFKQLANYDELTGIYNRRAVEAKITEILPQDGALLVCDLDYFKNINDKYGHLEGDECLTHAARLLRYIMRTGDIVGRIGGDEFVIFANGLQTESSIKTIVHKIEERFQLYNSSARIPLSVTIGYAFAEPGDDYKALFDRADQDLLKKKQMKHATGKGSDDWFRDLDQIRYELKEQREQPIGSFAQDFESFKKIYAFVERALNRGNHKACLVLLSLVGDEGQSFSPADRFELMELLAHYLQNNLRMGDVYTRYSSSQYLILLTEASKDDAEKVADRIRTLFLQSAQLEGTADVLIHYSEDLEPAQ